MKIMDLSFCKILKLAIKNGYTINTAHTIQEAFEDAKEYLLNVTPIQVLKYCPVQTIGSLVFVCYSFQEDYYYRDNVIIDESYIAFQGNKVIHSEFINSKGQHVGLYDFKKETN